MTLSEFYAEIGGDYENVLGRFRGEERVAKFLRMFLADTSIADLRKNMAEENYQEAFRAAHTLKGVASNLGFTSMQAAASEVTEALRSGDADTAKTLMPGLDALCDKTIDAINSLSGE